MDEVAQQTLDWAFLGNTLESWLIAGAISIATFVGLLLLRSVVTRNLRRITARTNTDWDDILLRALSATRQWLFLVVAISAGSAVLILPERVRALILALTSLAVLLQVGIWGTAAIRAYVEAYGRRRIDDDAGSVMTVRAIGFIVSLVLWAIVLLVVLENWGVDVTALIAGLGIGGIAVALATQNVLSDLFGSLSIVLDKPFVVGDFIVVENLSGTVERVGLKTTRVRSISGEQLVFANTDLLQSRIANYKRMFERRIVFSFGVAYGTAREDLEWIAEQVAEIVTMQPEARFDRAHFHRFGESSLDFEAVYNVLVPDYGVFMDTQQNINLDLYERLSARGISFAFPTRVVHVAPAESST